MQAKGGHSLPHALKQSLSPAPSHRAPEELMDQESGSYHTTLSVEGKHKPGLGDQRYLKWFSKKETFTRLGDAFRHGKSWARPRSASPDLLLCPAELLTWLDSWEHGSAHPSLSLEGTNPFPTHTALS